MNKILIAAIAVGCPILASAQAYNTGFESTETPAWNAATSTPFLGPWGTSVNTNWSVKTTTAATALTPAFTAIQGNQVATLSTIASSGSNFNADAFNFNGFTGFAKFTLTSDIYIDSANTGANRQIGLQMKGVNALFMVDKSGAVWGQNSGFTTSQLGTVSGLMDRWNTFTIDFDATVGTMTGYINGQSFLIQSGISSTSKVNSFALYSRYNSGGGTANVGNSVSRAYFDNVSVVPEPASMIALGLGAFGLIAKKRRK
jgi:hypothetical protein